MRNPMLSPLFRFAGGLRFPTLFVMTAILFIADVLVPDFIPFIDEILLGLGTLVLASLRRPKGSADDARPR